jgi:hypothetical protein
MTINMQTGVTHLKQVVPECTYVLQPGTAAHAAAHAAALKFIKG